MIDHTRLSKVISHALRHAPEEYSLTLDRDGWVDILSLLKGIKEIAEFKNLKLDDILNVVNSSQKRRHEIEGYNIRAVYGHSTETELRYLKCIPPDILYHGTSENASRLILLEGLKPMKRRYVHLSSNISSAIRVGKRKEMNPVILNIAAGKAHTHGVIFYYANDDTWLTEFIPSKFIETTKL